MAEYIDEQGCTWESYSQYVALELCGLCGCGDPAIKDDLIGLILQYGIGVIYPPPGWDDKYFELCCHVLDHAGLTEHGSIITGSWLNVQGQAVRAHLQADPQA